MRKSGVLRRVVILILFACFYSHFVLDSSHFMWTDETRQWLHLLLYAAIAWGIITLFGDRFAERSNNRETERHDDDSS